MAIAAHAAAAQAPAEDAATAQIESFVRARIGDGYRVEMRFGRLPSLRLAPCGRIEPFLAQGARLWGRTAIGVRCLQGANWTVSIPVTVNVFGRALVPVRPIRAGEPVTPNDVRLAEVELSRDPASVLTDPGTLSGRIAARPLPAGQALRVGHLRIQPTISAGDPVQIRIRGSGFTISADGSALSAAGPGQALRVRTRSGKVLVGTVVGRSVVVSL